MSKINVFLTALVLSMTLSLASNGQPGPPQGRMGPGGMGGSPMRMIPPIPGVAVDLQQGAWAQYSIHQGHMQGSIKFAVVGTQACEKSRCKWLEMTMNMPVGVIVMKMLISGDPRTPGNVKKMLIKTPDGRVQEIPMTAMGMGMNRQGGGGPGRTMGRPGKTAEKPPNFKEMGKENVKIGSKTYKARHFVARKGTKEMHAWISKDVKLFHLVKLSAPMMSLQLTSFGTGAKASF
ncbi:MAG: DUF3108 domain-containing protein [Deltaproteobacteria bacterium]|nr:DUF3108 domain-containing protein [Deltaproteobacteria bacterium]